MNELMLNVLTLNSSPRTLNSIQQLNQLHIF